MARWLKRLLVLAGLGTLLAAGSYAGARFTAGKALGPNPPLSVRRVEFNFKGVRELAGHPRAWVFTYTRSRLRGVPLATVYVSVTGTLLATRPADLRAQIDAWVRAQQP